MAKTTEQRHAEVMQRALMGFDQVQATQRPIREQCLQDRRFVYVPSAQWEGGLQEQFAERPRFEINKVQKAVIRIFSEYRNNRISVQFRPKDDDADNDTADTLNGMFRADEQESNAQEAYDAAFDEGVAGGMGAWRLCNEYEDEGDEENDKQHICIYPIFDADVSVFFDANAKRQDKADATQCWVIQSFTRPTYTLNWSDESISMQQALLPTAAQAAGNGGRGIVSFDSEMHLTEFDWFSADVVYTAEYYEVEMKRVKVQTFQSHVDGVDPVKLKGDEITDDAVAGLVAQGYYLAREKNVKIKRIHKYIIDGVRVLEDCGLLAGPNIPIVPFYGKRMFVDNVERFQGHIRLAIDPQRLYNMVVSMIAAIAATTPTRKPIFTPEQMVGVSDSWSEDNHLKPYLLANPVKNADGSIAIAGPTGYLEPPPVPEALAGLVQLLGSDLNDILGGQEATEQVVSNIAHKTVELIQSNLDMNSFIYMDSMAKAMRRCGEIWLGMTKEVYVEDGRKVRTIDDQDQEGQAVLQQPMTGTNGVAGVKNDLANGKYGVWVDVGPSFSNKRDAAVRTLVSLLQYTQDPTDQAAIVGTIVKMADGEGLKGVRDYFRKKLVGMGVEEPTDDEKLQMEQAQANAQPSANDQFLLASAKEADAKAGKAQADTIGALAGALKDEAAAIKSTADSAAGPDFPAMMALLQQIAQGIQQQGSPAPPVAAPQPEQVVQQ